MSGLRKRVAFIGTVGAEFMHIADRGGGIGSGNVWRANLSVERERLDY